MRCRSRRSEEHTSELQSQSNLVCRLLLEKKTHSGSSPSTARTHLASTSLRRAPAPSPDPLHRRATLRASVGRSLASVRRAMRLNHSALRRWCHLVHASCEGWRRPLSTVGSNKRVVAHARPGARTGISPPLCTRVSIQVDARGTPSRFFFLGSRHPRTYPLFPTPPLFR